MTNMVLRIDGMRCGECATQIREALEDVEGVQEVDVSHESGRANVTVDAGVEPSALEEAVKRTGFAAVAD